MYVFGVQEGIDESYFNLLSMYFKKKNIVRIQLNPKEDRVHGRGDGSFLSTKVKFGSLIVCFCCICFVHATMGIPRVKKKKNK